MSGKITPKQPFVISMYGFPGSGKTAFARQMSEELGIIHLQEDRILHELFGGSISPATKKASRKVMNFILGDYLKAGMSVMYDASVLRASERRRVREITHQYRAANLLVWLQVDPETCFDRTRKRDHRKADDKYAPDYTEDDFREILSYMQNPNLEDYIVVSGKHTFNTQRSAVVKRLMDMGIISVEEAAQNIVKPGLMNLVPKSNLQMRGDIINRNIPLR